MGHLRSHGYSNRSDMYMAPPSLKLEHDDYPLELKECSLEFIECQAETYIFMIGCPLLVTLCLIGNSLTFSVMMRAKLRRTATAVFIATLAIMDTVATLTGLTRHFVLKIFTRDIRLLAPISCQMHRFILYLSLDTSSWLLGFIAIERFVAVCKPQYYKKLRSASVALKIIAAVILLQIAFNIQVFWTRGKHWTEVSVFDNNHQIQSVEMNCGYTSETSRFFWTHYQGGMVLAWYCLIPFIVMLVLDIFIIRKLRSLQHSSVNGNDCNMSASGLAKQTNSMTRMLLSVTLYFLIVTTPVFVFTMFQSMLFYNTKDSAVELLEEDEHRIAKLELVDACLTMLLYLNHSINFFLYCLTGRRFRRELRAMFSCIKPSNKIINTRKLSKKLQAMEMQQTGHSLHTDYHTMPASTSPMIPKTSCEAQCGDDINISGI